MYLSVCKNVHEGEYRGWERVLDPLELRGVANCLMVLGIKLISPTQGFPS